MGIFAVPRSVLLAGQDPDDEGKKVLLHIKCNLGEKAEALSYSLELKQIEIDGETINTGGIVWHGEKDGITAESVLGSRQDPDKRSSLGEAKEWLAGHLETGEVSMVRCLSEGKKSGFSEETLKRARRSIGESVKIGFGQKSYWVWRLPDKDPHEGCQRVSEGCQTQDLDTLSKNIGKNGQKPQQNHEECQTQGLTPLAADFDTLSNQEDLTPELLTDEEVLKIDY